MKPKRFVTAAAAAALSLLAAFAPGGAALGADPAGDNVRVLTLPEAVALALDRGYDVAGAREFRETVAGRYVEERSAALPQVTFLSGAQRSWDGSTVMPQFMAPGTSVSFGRFDLTQPLYTWGQVESALKAARIGFATADDRLAAARQGAERAATAGFLDVLLAKEFRTIAARNLEQKERHLAEAKKRLAGGVATDYDVLVAQVAVENARPDLLRAENLVRAAREALRFTLGIGKQPVDAQGTLDAPDETPPTFEEAIAAAWKFRPELSELRNRQKIAREVVSIADAGDKPRLDLKASAGYQDVRTMGLDGHGKTWSGGIYLSWPLFDGKRTRGRVAQAESDARSLGIEEARLVDAVSLQARLALDNLALAAGIVAAASGTVGQAEKLLSLAEKGYEFGVKTRLEVEDAELNLTAARGNLARARHDLLLARVDLRHIMGTLGRGAAAQAAPSGKTWTPAATNEGIVREILSGMPELQEGRGGAK
jgi:HAE1 family hydrophobic/amphiphilic exporter-1